MSLPQSRLVLEVRKPHSTLAEYLKRVAACESGIDSGRLPTGRAETAGIQPVGHKALAVLGHCLFSCLLRRKAAQALPYVIRQLLELHASRPCQLQYACYDTLLGLRKGMRTQMIG